LKMGKKNYGAILLFSAAIFLFPIFTQKQYFLSTMIFIALNAITCMGLVVLMGYSGQVSLGHAAFVGIGAYTTGILTVRLGWPISVALVMAICLNLVIAFVVGSASLRLKGYYLAMATLAFGGIVQMVLMNWTKLTGGTQGLLNIPSISILGLKINTDLRFYYLVWMITIAILWICLNMFHSRLGRAWQAIRNSEVAAEATGINIGKYKVLAFMVSALYASVSGSLFAHYMNFLDPSPYTVMASVWPVLMIVIGGRCSVWGGIVGAGILSIMHELFQKYLKDFDTLAYGCLLVVILIFMNEGLVVGLPELFKKVYRKLSNVGG